MAIQRPCSCWLKRFCKYSNTYGRNLQNMVKDSVLPKVWARMKDIMLTVKTTFTHLPFIYVTLMIQNKTKEETRMNRKVFLTVCSMWNIFVSEIFSMLRMFDNVQKEQFSVAFQRSESSKSIALITPRKLSSGCSVAEAHRKVLRERLYMYTILPLWHRENRYLKNPKKRSWRLP